MTQSPLLRRAQGVLLCAAALLSLAACQRRDNVPTPETSPSVQPDTRASAPLPQTPASSASAMP